MMNSNYMAAPVNVVGEPRTSYKVRLLPNTAVFVVLGGLANGMNAEGITHVGGSYHLR
jgi:hypothetical protein